MSANDDIRQLLEQRRQARKQHRDASGRFAKKTVDEIARELGLDTSDIRVRALASQEVSDPEREVLRLAVKMHHTKPSEADAPSHLAGTPDVKTREQRLLEEYKAGSQGLFGRDLINFKRYMREKGLPIS